MRNNNIHTASYTFGESDALAGRPLDLLTTLPGGKTVNAAEYRRGYMASFPYRLCCRAESTIVLPYGKAGFVARCSDE